MAPRPPLANSIRCEMQWTGPNSVKANNIFYALSSSYIGSVANLTNFVEQWQGIITSTGWRPALNLASTWSLTQLSAADNSGESEDLSYTSLSVPGSVSGNSLPPNCAVCISWPIAARYRGGHPRWYLAGVPESYLATPGGNMITAAASTGYVTVYDEYLLSFNAITVASATVQMGTLSYYTGKALRPTPVFRAFGSCNVSLRLDSQRRRLGKEPRIG